MRNASWRDPAYAHERQATQNFVLGKRLRYLGLDVDAVLEQHDHGARPDGGADQVDAILSFENLHREDQIIRTRCVVSHSTHNSLRAKHVVAEREATESETAAFHDLEVGSAHDRNAR